MKSTNIAVMSLIAFILMLSASQVSLGQTTGLLKGQITDKLDAGIEWAQVIVTRDSEKHELKVNKEGKFELALPQGDYVLIGQAKAFHSSSQINIKIVAGQTAKVDLSLDVDTRNAVCLLLIEGVSEKEGAENKEKQKSEKPENPIKEKQNRHR